MTTTTETEWRDQVAAAVRRVTIIATGGTCFNRAVLGAMALQHLGMRPSIRIGAMIYRVGQDETLDVVAFCGQGNRAVVPGLFHVWLEADGCIIDFASGDWRREAPGTVALSAAVVPAERDLRPICFEIDPPDYIWRPAHELTQPWTPDGTPELGELWYQAGIACDVGGDDMVRDYCNEGIRQATEEMRMMWPTVRAALPPPRAKAPGQAAERRLRQLQRQATR